MKKLVSLLLVSVFCVAGMFAVDFGAFPKGTWQDSNWDADWVFGVGSLQLVDSNSGDVIFDFEGKIVYVEKIQKNNSKNKIPQHKNIIKKGKNIKNQK